MVTLCPYPFSEAALQRAWFLQRHDFSGIRSGHENAVSFSHDTSYHIAVRDKALIVGDKRDLWNCRYYFCFQRCGGAQVVSLLRASSVYLWRSTSICILHQENRQKRTLDSYIYPACTQIFIAASEFPQTCQALRMDSPSLALTTRLALQSRHPDVSRVDT